MLYKYVSPRMVTKKGALRMKPVSPLALVLVFSLLGHYFVLTYFKIDYLNPIVAEVKSTRIKGVGLYKRAELEIKIERNFLGKKVVEKKNLYTWDKEAKNIKVGNKYLLNAKSNWLLNYKVVSL